LTLHPYLGIGKHSVAIDSQGSRVLITTASAEDRFTAVNLGYRMSGWGRQWV
jgi:hypothetical protein